MQRWYIVTISVQASGASLTVLMKDVALLIDISVADYGMLLFLVFGTRRSDGGLTKSVWSVTTE